MSHFTVLVIGGDPDALLAPYDETLGVEPYWKPLVDRADQHWYYAHLVKEGKLPMDATLEELLAALNEAFPEDTEEEALRVENGVLEQRSTYNPNSKWDWYQIGGRWRGMFLLKEPIPMLGEFTPVVGKPGVGDNEPHHEADQALKVQIDWDGMRAAARQEGEETWQGLEAALRNAGLTLADEPGTFEAFRDKRLPPDIAGRALSDLSEEEQDRQAAAMREIRATWQALPFNAALADAGIYFFLVDPVEEFCLAEDDPREAYLARCELDAGVPFALVTPDGEWHEKGRMGWFGVGEEQPEAVWAKKVREVIDAQPDDMLFTMVDCHI